MTNEGYMIELFSVIFVLLFVSLESSNVITYQQYTVRD